jgi:hypothetical protein
MPVLALGFLLYANAHITSTSYGIVSSVACDGSKRSAQYYYSTLGTPLCGAEPVYGTVRNHGMFKPSVYVFIATLVLCIITLLLARAHKQKTKKKSVNIKILGMKS